MKLIQPNTRLQFSAADLEYVVQVLTKPGADPQTTRNLLADPDTRDALLDHEALYRGLIEGLGCLQVSAHLYFYVLCRRVLRQAGIGDVEVADYVASMLTEFTRTDRMRARVPGQRDPLDYFFDMLAALPGLDSRTAFTLRAHMGNRALFATGLFAGQIRRREERRGAPGLGYYERLGEASFRSASESPLADRLGLERVLRRLSECFHEARLGLNDLAERLVSLGEAGAAADRLLIRA